MYLISNHAQRLAMIFVYHEVCTQTLSAFYLEDQGQQKRRSTQADGRAADCRRRTAVLLLTGAASTGALCHRPHYRHGALDCRCGRVEVGPLVVRESITVVVRRAREVLPRILDRRQDAVAVRARGGRVGHWPPAGSVALLRCRSGVRLVEEQLW